MQKHWKLGLGVGIPPFPQKGLWAFKCGLNSLAFKLSLAVWPWRWPWGRGGFLGPLFPVYLGLHFISNKSQIKVWHAVVFGPLHLLQPVSSKWACRAGRATCKETPSAPQRECQPHITRATGGHLGKNATAPGGPQDAEAQDGTGLNPAPSLCSRKQ